MIYYKGGIEEQKDIRQKTNNKISAHKSYFISSTLNTNGLNPQNQKVNIDRMDKNKPLIQLFAIYWWHSSDSKTSRLKVEANSNQKGTGVTILISDKNRL